MKERSKRYKEISKAAVKDKKINVKEIIELVKKNSTTKFDESIDVSLRINLKQSKGGDLSLRTIVKLPNGSGKKNKIAVLCESDKIDEAKKTFDERLENINFDTYYNDLPFNPSALSLYKWAPISEELKTLDRKIVLNSMILKWDIIKKEFESLIQF